MTAAHMTAVASCRPPARQQLSTESLADSSTKDVNHDKLAENYNNNEIFTNRRDDNG